MKTNNMKKVDIGLDIGIASVGWAITDIETLNIEEYGARLFPTVDNEKDSKLKNETRREARSARRQNNRRKTLRRDFIKLLMTEKLITQMDIQSKSLIDDFIEKHINIFSQKDYGNELPLMFKMRKDAVGKSISKKELIAVLYWYINHRGFKYEIAGSKELKETKKLIDQFNIKNSLPIDSQINYFKENHYLNGSFNRIFHSNDYIKELNLIFDKQDVSKEFKEKIISLFKRQRSFEDGPGNEDTPTQYGRHYFLEKIRGTTKLVKRKDALENIWDKTVGKCTFYKEETRAPKKSVTSLIFNLLNELNNVSIFSTGEVLTKTQKLDILKIAFKQNDASNKIVAYILKEFNLDKEDKNEIKGFVWDSKGKAKITSIESYHALKKLLPDNFSAEKAIILNNSIVKDNIFDKLVNIYSKNKVIEKRFASIEKEFKGVLTDEQISNLSKISFSGSETHSLSYKAMQNMIPDLITIPKMNQMKWAQNNGIKFNEGIDFGTKYLKSEWIEDVIATPSVKRSFRETMKVLNAILQLAKDRNFEIRSIIVEMARETKNKDMKDAETNRNKYFESKRQDILGFIEKISGLKLSLSNKIINKIWLLEQQGGKDAYTGQEIKAEDVINNPGKYDIDHIIPYSQSFSNNRSNKVLTLQQNNHKKGNKTPWQYLSSSDFNKMKSLWEQWYKNPKDLRFKDSNKLDFLSSQLDFSKSVNQLGFIQRNIVDTRYTTKAVLSALKGFSNNENNEYNFNVKAINGKMTSFGRGKISFKRNEFGKIIDQLKRPKGLELYEVDEEASKTSTNIDLKPIMKKSRVWNGHHAEDAYILTVLNSHYNDSKAIEKVINSSEKFNDVSKNKVSKEDTYINNNFKELLSKFDIARTKLNNKMDNIRFSRMVEKKINTKLFNETMYKGKVDGDIVKKYSHKYILNNDFKPSEFFGENPKNREKLLMYKYNKNLYNALNDVYLNYQDEKLPFTKAKEDAGGNDKHLKVTYKNKKGKQITSMVSKINYEDGKKNPFRIVTAKNNKNSFYEHMNWVAIQIYKNKSGKYKIIPLDASNHTFKTNKDGNVKLERKIHKINLQKYAKGIDLNSNPMCTLYKGDLIKLSNDEGIAYFVGHVESADKLEVKFLSRSKLVGEKSQDQRTINKKLIGSQIIKSNILGTKFKKKFIF